LRLLDLGGKLLDPRHDASLLGERGERNFHVEEELLFKTIARQRCTTAAIAFYSRNGSRQAEPEAQKLYVYPAVNRAKGWKLIRDVAAM